MSRQAKSGLAPGNSDADPCDHPRETESVCAGLPLRANFGYAPFENMVLDLSRLICDLHCNSTTKSWMHAMELAERVRGPSEGPLLIARVTTFLRALLTERTSGFQYLSAGCLHISPHEQLLMNVLVACRDDGSQKLRVEAEALAGQPRVHRLMTAAQILARLEEHEGKEAAACDGDGTAAPGPTSQRPPLLH